MTEAQCLYDHAGIAVLPTKLQEAVQPNDAYVGAAILHLGGDVRIALEQDRDAGQSRNVGGVPAQVGPEDAYAAGAQEHKRRLVQRAIAGDRQT